MTRIMTSISQASIRRRLACSRHQIWRMGALSAALLALAAQPTLAQEKTVKIGFISTFSGPAAAIGNDMKNSFELALDHHGRKLGGLPVEVI